MYECIRSYEMAYFAFGLLEMLFYYIAIIPQDINLPQYKETHSRSNSIVDVFHLEEGLS